MELIVSPRPWRGLLRGTTFLAGGIKNCPDWQSGVIDQLRHLPLVIFNPRRNVFDEADPSVCTAQYEWEGTHLDYAHAILFWFPKESSCPSTLFEFGQWYMNVHKRIFIAMHPEYSHRRYLEVQIKGFRPHYHVSSSLDELVNEVTTAFNARPW